MRKAVKIVSSALLSGRSTDDVSYMEVCDGVSYGIVPNLPLLPLMWGDLKV